MKFLTIPLALAVALMLASCGDNADDLNPPVVPGGSIEEEQPDCNSGTSDPDRQEEADCR